MRIGKWRRSQSSNGYYIKSSGNLPIFIRIESNELGQQKIYDIMLKKGLEGIIYPIRREYSLQESKKWMINYMKNHPFGW